MKIVSIGRIDPATMGVFRMRISQTTTVLPGLGSDPKKTPFCAKIRLKIPLLFFFPRCFQVEVSLSISAIK